MAYMITDDCINCGGCEDVCENEAIIADEVCTVIDPSRCTDCVGIYPIPLCAEVCPVDACMPDPDHEESEDRLLEKWRSLHPSEIPAFVL